MSAHIMGQLPPVTPCPPWCDEGFHPWEPDGDEFIRTHRSRELAPESAQFSLEIYTIDGWRGGEVDRAEPCVVLDGQCYYPAELEPLVGVVGLLQGLGGRPVSG